MIIDLKRFLVAERPHWTELETMLKQIELYPERHLELGTLMKFHQLYERASADLAKVETFASEPALRRYLEDLVARAYCEIHETREKTARLNPWRWFTTTFPQTFRRRIGPFWLSLAITIAGCSFGAVAIRLDPDAKGVFLQAFPHLKETPAERVKKEEAAQKDRLAEHKGDFAAELMSHNIRVTMFTMALGISWGVGTTITLFYNGVILGAVGMDYVAGGQTVFLLGWLLPHGAVEIPSILLGGQAGLLLAGALIGWGSRKSRRVRLREISSDLVTLIFGTVVLLFWAGIMESFLSHYHQPVIPYALKIAFGATELITLTIFLSRAGRKT